MRPALPAQLARHSHEWAFLISTFDGAHELGESVDVAMPAASTFKVVVALELFAQAAEGRIELSESSGVYQDRFGKAGATLRQLVFLMMVYSDNLATDAIMDRVGGTNLLERLHRLDLNPELIPPSAQDFATAWLAELDRCARSVGFPSWRNIVDRKYDLSEAELRRLERLSTETIGASVRSPTATARELTRLLREIWSDRAAAPRACRAVRSIMAHSVVDRIAAGFDRSRVRVCTKAGTVAGLVRNDIGVVHLPDGESYSVVMLCRARAPFAAESEIDRAIGEASAVAVNTLRRIDRGKRRSV